ncbi:cytochrome P450 2B1-like [Nannospalax galili]|uniref:cytochrome P450 2B1-like n=1 Tax=Nannospalax galili TaxID=1026970 RepID=UPI000819BFB1|nr:cytochrome P450 2B1-like [Nannospalax galili]
MELSVLLLLALLAGFLLLMVRGQPKARGHLPPGPRPLPILGNLLQMDRRGLLSSFMRIRQKYGDVFTVYLGPRPVVMLCGTEAIREALVDQAEDFSGRGTIAVVEPIFKDYGVVFASGERWKALRRFSLATMRDFGMGKRSVEERIQEEAQCLVEELRKSQGTRLAGLDSLLDVSISYRNAGCLGCSPSHVGSSVAQLDMNPNTEVYPLLSSALHDPRYFEKPDTFNPDHFLDANGALKKNEAFMPFSIGKRICLGEGIARNELFLFFTTILQNFSVSSPVAPKDIDLTPKESGVGRVPPTYQISFLPR